MYELERISKTYRQGGRPVPALVDVDLTIGDGEFLAVQGQTGGGKSTLLQLLGALDKPTSGTIKLGGADLGRMGSSELTRVRATQIGFVFQSFNLIPTLTAQENVETALAPNHVDVRERRDRAKAALESVGLGDRAPTCRASSPAVSSSASRSPGRWSSSRRCCSRTSPPVRSTRTPAARSSACSSRCGRSAGSRSSSSRTTPGSRTAPSAGST